MKKTILISALASALFLISSNSIAAGGHDGHGGGSNKGGRYCKKAVIGHIKPKHLSTVAPGSEFSFWVEDMKDANQIEVTAKKIPVEMTSEQRTGFILFKGKLPASLVNTAARVQVKATTQKCPAQKGWLLKISE